MELTEQIRYKILADLSPRSIIPGLKPMPKMGTSKHEFGHKFYTSPLPGYENTWFVISEVLVYHNTQQTDHQYKVYPYSAKGVFLEKYDAKKFNGKFFKTKVLVRI